MIFSIIFVLFFSMAASVLGTKVLSQQQITNDGWEHKYPDVYGNIIVWDDFRDDNHNIYGYNLLTNQEFLIAADINGDENSFNDGTQLYGVTTLPGRRMAKYPFIILRQNR